MICGGGLPRLISDADIDKFNSSAAVQASHFQSIGLVKRLLRLAAEHEGLA
jgi:hypothetical protein